MTTGEVMDMLELLRYKSRFSGKKAGKRLLGTISSLQRTKIDYDELYDFIYQQPKDKEPYFYFTLLDNYIRDHEPKEDKWTNRKAERPENLIKDLLLKLSEKSCGS